MNIRVDDTKIREITQAGSTIEAKGDVSVGVQEAAVGQAEEVKSGQAVSVQQTKVDAPFFREESQIEKIQQAAQQQELQQFREQMEVVCNTASEKDCSLMEEDGFSLGSTEAGAIVTEMDKIKMELAQAGADISVFGDALSSQQLCPGKSAGIRHPKGRPASNRGESLRLPGNPCVGVFPDGQQPRDGKVYGRK